VAGAAAVTGQPARYAVIGRGWRAAFYTRLAELMPDRFQVTGVLDRAGTVADLLHAGPEFVVTSVSWEANPGLVEELVARDVAVLSETPPAPDLAGLRALWSRVGARDLVQVAEQYLLLPGHAARLSLVRGGIIGTPTSAQISSTHGYHAVSVLRGLLGAGFAPAVVSARAFTAPLADPLTRDGWRGDGTVIDAVTTIATVDFGETMGLYDFTDNQWWNPLRARRIVVRGSHGELVDDRVVRLADPRTPVESALIRRQTGQDLNLEGADLDHISFDGDVVYRNDFAGARLSDEDIAIATMLARTAAWRRGDGPAPYPLAEACQDHLISLAIEESATTGQPVSTSREAWAR
jgi:predicted dehydrogenase